MVLRPKLDMYCKCSDKCKRPTICAEKVCAVTIDADFINAFVGDFDEINAKTIKAESVTADQFIVNVPAGAPKPTVEILDAAPPTATTAPDLALPVFGVPFGGFDVAPGAIGDLPTVSGSNVIGTLTFSAPIAGGTVLKVTYGGGGFPATSTLVVSFYLQDIDLNAEGYTLPAAPQVVDSTNTFFSVLFPDPILSMSSTWAYAVTEIVFSA
jgi:hypothetical protein